MIVGVGVTVGDGVCVGVSVWVGINVSVGTSSGFADGVAIVTSSDPVCPVDSDFSELRDVFAIILPRELSVFPALTMHKRTKRSPIPALVQLTWSKLVIF